MSIDARVDIALWDYQQAAYEATELGLSANKHTLLVMPTGSGKTILAREIVLKYLGRGQRVLWLAHRRELLAQAQRSIGDGLSIQSVQGFKSDGDAYDLIVTDEAHHCTAKSYKRIYALYPNALRLGLSATPERLDGTGLGSEFDVMVQTTNVERLISDGHLASIRYFVPEHTIETAGVKTSMGDYDKVALSKNARHPQVIADAIGEYKAHAEGRRGIVFCLDQDHSREVTAAYVRAGYRAASIDSKTPTKRRDEIFRQWDEESIDIICNCALFVEGLDIKNVDFVQVLRPTQSRALYFQMIGRGMRKSDKMLHVLDHTTNWADIGLPSRHHEYKLTEEAGKGSAIGNRTRMMRSESGELVDTGEKIAEYRSPRLVALDLLESQKDQVKAFIADHQDWTNLEISAHFDVSQATIWIWRKEWGIGNPRTHMDRDQVAAIKTFIGKNQHLSDSNIARQFCVSKQVINRHRKALGLPNKYSRIDMESLKAFVMENPGWTNRKIAKHIGVGRAKIIQARAGTGIDEPQSKSSNLLPSKVEEIKKFIIENPEWSNRKIAKHLCVGDMTVRRYRKFLSPLSDKSDRIALHGSVENHLWDAVAVTEE